MILKLAFWGECCSQSEPTESDSVRFRLKETQRVRSLTHASALFLLCRKFDTSGEQEFDLERIRQRQAEVQKIEESIDSTNHIFRTLHRLTHEQADTIDQIENNIDSTLLNINQGTEHLKKARDYHVSASNGRSGFFSSDTLLSRIQIAREVFPSILMHSPALKSSLLAALRTLVC